MRQQSGESSFGQSMSRPQSLRSQHSKRSSKHSKTLLNGEQRYQQGFQTKLEKRSSGRSFETETHDQIEIERAFRMHSRNKIGRCPALFSLKLLGYNCKSEQDFVKFNKIWMKYGKDYIDQQNFKNIVLEIKSKGQMKDNYEVFTILTQQKNILDRSRLEAIGKQIGKNVTGLIQSCGKDGTINYSQFDTILKFTNTFR